MENQVKPYSHLDTSKKLQIAEMFDNIAPKYDLLNHILSMGIDRLWRKKAVGLLKKFQPRQILDMATGTGDFAFQLNDLQPEKITGIDLSPEMIKIAKLKAVRKNRTNTVFSTGDSEQIAFPDFTFDAVTCAFGVRNFQDLALGLKEMHRVLKPGGKVVILEFSKPEHFPIKQVYFFYFKHILPFVGKLISKDAQAYTYLPESVNAFPYGSNFIQILTSAGFENPVIYKLSFGIASVYFASKKIAS